MFGKILLFVGLFFVFVALAGVWSDEHGIRTDLARRLDDRDFAIRKAGEYGPLIQEGWKRQTEWVQIQTYPDAPRQADEWRMRVREKLQQDFGVDVANRFNIGIAATTLGPFFDHMRRVQELNLIVQEIRRGDLHPLSKPQSK